MSRSHPARYNRPCLILLRDDPVDAALGSQPVLVDLKGIRLERTRDFGDIWLAWGLWRLLGLDRLLQQEMPRGRAEVSWHLVAAILAIARFCEPSSELHIETTWYRRTALEELLNLPPEKVHTDRLYAGLDELLPHKEAIEKHLKQRLGQLFELDYELLLYDVTSTYFEGQCKGNPQAKRGYSRDKRPDCLQVCIALVVTTDGMPLGYEVFDGNRHDSTTVEEIVTTIEKKHGKANRIWVLDRGMVREDNLSFVRGREGRYIVGTPKASLRKFEAELVEKKDWDHVEAGVQVPLPRTRSSCGRCRPARRRTPGTSASTAMTTTVQRRPPTPPRTARGHRAAAAHRTTSQPSLRHRRARSPAGHHAHQPSSFS